MKKINNYIVLVLLWIIPLMAFAKSSVWVAEKDNKKIYLAGSVHLIHPSQLPLPTEYQTALDLSTRVVFELDFDTLEDPDVPDKILKAFQLPQGVTLDKTLDAAVWQRLKGFLVKNSIPDFAFNNMEAAYVSFSLPIMLWKNKGYHDGIDRMLFDKAKQLTKQFDALETFDEQLLALASLKKIDPNFLIVEMLKELEEPKYDLSELIKKVYKGDVAVMALFVQEMRVPEYEVLYQNLLVNRNKAWLKKIDQYRADGVPTFIVVGALHFVGDDGLLALLEKQGYHISFLQE